MANEKRLIDANALKSQITRYHSSLTPRYISKLVDAEIGDIIDIIDEADTVDAVEVVHGWWIMGVDEGDYEYGTCSVCGYNEYNAFCCLLPHNYCPNCGAKMDGERKDNET